MSLYNAAKDALKVAQKADNVGLVHKLLNAQQQALYARGSIAQRYHWSWAIAFSAKDITTNER
jgi:hypothetical protein